MSDELREAALRYHERPRPGKIEVSPIKPLANPRDLALAYSPGVAAPCEEIAANPACAANYTARGNLVAVISNGSAVLGLGNIGALASKPVMEGKGCLFKTFAGIDVFDIEVNESDPDKLVDIIASLEPTFGGVNLEDIKAPECFVVEQKLKERMNIPVFHDDQHGTAIIAAAATLNAVSLIGKQLSELRLVVSGAGAAAIACVKLLIEIGIDKQNILLTDRAGVVYLGRDHYMDPVKAEFAQETDFRTLAEAIKGADMFLGLSAPDVLKPEMLETMAECPIVLALANPVPEIMPDVAKTARPDVIMATGRSDFPNQVNNVLCFPFLFRGALDVGATTINEEMKIACVKALADLAKAGTPSLVSSAYRDEDLRFGTEYLIPKPMDPRLLETLAPAVARAAMESGAATRPIEDLHAYALRLSAHVFKSGVLMRPVFEAAQGSGKCLVYAEAEDPRALEAIQTVLAEDLARVVLVGRPRVLKMRIERAGLRLDLNDERIEVVDPEDDPRFKQYAEAYYKLMSRRGVTPADAKTIVRTQNTVIAAMLVTHGAADAMLCGLTGHYHDHLEYVTDIFGLNPGVRCPAALNVLVMKGGTVFLGDTQVNPEPAAEDLANVAALGAKVVQGFGIEPRIALLSHSNFGSSDHPSAARMREAVRVVRRRLPQFEVEGEMHADFALLPKLRRHLFPDSTLSESASLLLMPSLDAANIAMNLLTVYGEGKVVGPILMGLNKPAHILTPAATVRRVVNMSALAVMDAIRTGSDEKTGSE